MDMSPDPPPELRLDLSADTFKQGIQPLSTPIDLYGLDGFDVDNGDLRRFSGQDLVASLTPLSSGPCTPNYEQAGARSFFANVGASKSACKIDTGGDKGVGGIGGLAPSSHHPYGRKAPGSTPELSLFGRTRKEQDKDPDKNKDDAAGVKDSRDTGLLVRENYCVPSRGPSSNLELPLRRAGNGQAADSTSTVANQNSPQTGSSADFTVLTTAPTVPVVLVASQGAAPIDHQGKSNTGSQASEKHLPQVARALRLDAPMMSRKLKPATPSRPGPSRAKPSEENVNGLSTSAPPEKERSFRDVMRTSMRNRSEDRAATLESEEDKPDKSKAGKESRSERSSERELHPLSSSLRKNNGSTFLSEIKTSSSKAADGLGKAGKGFFTKLTRSGSSHEKALAVPEEEYVVKVLKLPLVEQTRITRIAKSYDLCRDKTEFWMPALPWRCIDFLNGQCEEEGLYRLSGSILRIKTWRKRFDTELDINLLDEPEVYDVMAIASLFKEWIRELPEEIFPKPLQLKVVDCLPSREDGAKPVPQALRDELSNLPPFNYYLLFAITCHLSLLLSHETKNKMTLDNLYRCFNQSLKLDGRIFFTLVGDWRQCWQGCYTENEFLRAEYKYLQAPYPDYAITDAATTEERAMSSSASSKLPPTGSSSLDMQRPGTPHTQPSNLTEESDGEPIVVTKKLNRSSSDVTGLAPKLLAADK